ncbi:hypothetical protein EYF80_033804 [Liparis tanakae]|uniref:Uncharacterized protein n=1 Tax=Liparis tanakae TaxID=230148 RepID=A0A4Z2GRE1_9TELE|nr:hypothetical protein EYF80_033804 [Liparis tanakae]
MENLEAKFRALEEFWSPLEVVGTNHVGAGFGRTQIGNSPINPPGTSAGLWRKLCIPSRHGRSPVPARLPSLALIRCPKHLQLAFVHCKKQENVV